MTDYLSKGLIRNIVPCPEWAPASKDRIGINEIKIQSWLSEVDLTSEDPELHIERVSNSGRALSYKAREGPQADPCVTIQHIPLGPGHLNPPRQDIVSVLSRQARIRLTPQLLWTSSEMEEIVVAKQ
jgi:hypothetical protein